MLGYYRNPLNHAFFNEGLVIVSIYSYGIDKAWKDGVALDDLFKRACFMSKLLKREEVIQNRINSKNYHVFESILNVMMERRMIQKVGENLISLKTTSEATILFAAQLIWPMIDSYYITLMFTLSLIKNRGVELIQFYKRV